MAGSTVALIVMLGAALGICLLLKESTLIKRER